MSLQLFDQSARWNCTREYFWNVELLTGPFHWRLHKCNRRFLGQLISKLLLESFLSQLGSLLILFLYLPVVLCALNKPFSRKCVRVLCVAFFGEFFTFFLCLYFNSQSDFCTWLDVLCFVVKPIFRLTGCLISRINQPPACLTTRCTIITWGGKRS